jgi:xylulokinase
MAAVQNAGLALDWVRRLLGLDWPDLLAMAARVPAGAGGVSFLPFLTGERGGIAPVDSRGRPVRLTGGGRSDLVAHLLADALDVPDPRAAGALRAAYRRWLDRLEAGAAGGG